MRFVHLEATNVYPAHSWPSGVNHLLDYISLLINRAGISALVNYPVLIIIVEKEQVLLGRIVD